MTECNGEIIIDGEFTFCVLNENHVGDCIDTFSFKQHAEKKDM